MEEGNVGVESHPSYSGLSVIGHGSSSTALLGVPGNSVVVLSHYP